MARMIAKFVRWARGFPRVLRILRNISYYAALLGVGTSVFAPEDHGVATRIYCVFALGYLVLWTKPIFFPLPKAAPSEPHVIPPTSTSPRREIWTVVDAPFREKGYKLRIHRPAIVVDTTITDEAPVGRSYNVPPAR